MIIVSLGLFLLLYILPRVLCSPVFQYVLYEEYQQNNLTNRDKDKVTTYQTKNMNVPDVEDTRHENTSV